MGTGVPLYFAYGSNMSRAQMAERCPGAEALGPARLTGYALAFDRFSKRWDGYVADIVPHAGAETWGVLWRVTAAHLESLDRFEGVSSGAYRRTAVEAETPAGERHTAVAYQVVEPAAPGLPSVAYAATMARGASEHGLPDSYCEWLNQVLSHVREPQTGPGAKVGEQPND
jgi:cation transport regulator ChaC